MRGVIAVSLFSVAIGVSACGDRITSKATDERLNDLLVNGVDTDRQTKNNERLEKILSKDNSVGALQEDFSGQAAGGGTATLNALIGSAFERNTRIGRQAQAINLADAERLNAVFGYLPQVNITIGQDEVSQEVISTDNAVFELGEADFPVSTETLRIDQPLIDLSRIFGIQLARNAQTIAEVEYIRSVRDVAFDVFDAYVVALQSDTRRESLASRQRMVARQVTAARNLEATGLSDSIDLSSFGSEQAKTAADESLENSRYKRALSDLAFLSGRVVEGIDASSVSNGVLATRNAVSEDAAVEAGLFNNPLVIASALRVVGSEIEKRQALATDFSPVLSAYAALENDDREASRFGGGSETSDTTVGVRLRIPLFNGQGQGISSNPARVTVRASALEYYNTRRELETEIRATHARLQELNTSISQSSRAVNLAQRALSSERRRVDAGESVELAVASRQLRLNSVQEQRDFLRYEQIRAWGRLQYLMGVDLSKQLTR